MRSFECWVTHDQIMLSLSKYGFSEYAEKKHASGSFNMNISEKYMFFFEDFFWNTRHLYEKH